MKYISLDIETLGLNPEDCDVIEIGAIVEDTANYRPRAELPTFHCYVNKENYRGNIFALAMNAHILKKILELRKPDVDGIFRGNKEAFLLSPESIAEVFLKFMKNNNYLDTKPVIAGKNVAGFDLPFLNVCIPDWKYIKFHHRVIDPGMLYFNSHTDNVPPDLKECKKRAGLPELVTHEALDDAWDVIQLVRVAYPS